MKTIRRNTFETNSSSTHSLTLCDSKAYDGIGKDYFICYSGGPVASVDEIKKSLLDRYKSLSKDDVDLLWKAFLEHLEDFKKTNASSYDYDSSPEDIIYDLGLSETEYFKEYFKLPVNLKEIFNKELLNYMDLEIYDNQNNDSGLEWFMDDYTTQSGEKIIAFGYYGYPN